MQNWFVNPFGPSGMILWALLFFPFVLVLFDTFFRLLFLLLSFFPEHIEEADLGCHEGRLRILLLFLANNEERVISKTLSAALQLAQNDPNVEVAILADNCTDRTAEISSGFGVNVYRRFDDDPGKGKALSWFIQNAMDEIGVYDLIAIMDADTVIPLEFPSKVQAAFSTDKVKAVQAFIEPRIEKGFPFTVLAGYSEILAQYVDDAARTRTGWSVPLKGKGMVFRTDVFIMVCKDLQTQVDDIEISIRLAESNIPVRYFSDLRVVDPNTEILIGLARQRGRWLKGQRAIWTNLRGSLWRWLFSGFSNLSLLQALLIKPKTVVFLVKTLLLMIFSFWTARYGTGMILSMVMVASILIDLVYYLLGLRFVDDVKMYFLALLGAPVYFLLWLIGYLYSILPGQKWLRARD